jgi:pilus assembly protein CpaF
VHHELLSALGPKLYNATPADNLVEEQVREIIELVLAREDLAVARLDRTRLTTELVDEILGHGPIEPLLRDPSISEIMVNGPQMIFVEKYGLIHQVDATFLDEAHLRHVIDRIVSRIGRRVDEASPMVDARLPDGSRVNAVLPPVALDGPLLTIRKFAADPLSIHDLIRFGTTTQQVARFLAVCVRGRLDMLISGGTGSGKTTTLNVLSGFVPADERVITIEDSAELQLRQQHVLRMEARPPNIEQRGEVTIRDLVRNALRMRPDRIIIGEVRDGAALDLLQAMNTGHDGSLTTVHANSPRDSLARLETMALMARMELPVRAIREQIAAAIDLVVHQARMRDGSRRITHVSELVGMEGDVISMQDIFVFDLRSGHDDRNHPLGALRWTGLRPRLLDTLEERGIEVPVDLFEEPAW